MPRGAGKHAMIRGYPNGETRRVNTRQPLAEYIGHRWLTRGTETSKYPVERKSIETAQVAASERALAQTVPSIWSGVVGPAYGTGVDRGRTWKGSAQRVIPPYSKSAKASRCS